jgi:hypothetical protein
MHARHDVGGEYAVYMMAKGAESAAQTARETGFWLYLTFDAFSSPEPGSIRSKTL